MYDTKGASSFFAEFRVHFDWLSYFLENATCMKIGCSLRTNRNTTRRTRMYVVLLVLPRKSQVSISAIFLLTVL